MIGGLYRLALRAFPKSHRDRYAAEMLDIFAREVEARQGQRVEATRYGLAASVDAVVTGLAERRRSRVRRLGYAFSFLDVTLAWRMLWRFPGLTAVSVFGMTVGIAVAATALTAVSLMLDTRVPLPDGDRVVSIVSTDAETGLRELRLAHDYVVWRDLAAMAHVGISREGTRTLIAPGRTPEPVPVVELSASSFQVAGIAALRGRTLVADDEAVGAADVVVIGHAEWRDRFGSDPDIVGKSVQLGSVTHHIVGVMPEGYGFPVNSSFWVPWRATGATFAPRMGPRVGVYARLGADATTESAQAELAIVADRTAAESPSTHRHLRPRVLPYVYAFTDMGEPSNFLAMRAIQLAVVLLLVVVCVNVATLVYARTATRDGEIAVRMALGANRLGVIGQLLVEALVLVSVSAVAGLYLVSRALPFLEAQFLGLVGGRMPFWLDFRMSVENATVVAGLALVSAGIVGVLPGLNATRATPHRHLQRLSPGGGSRMQLGRLWTVLIVLQVAVTVAMLPVAMYVTWDGLRVRSSDAGFASQHVLSASLAMERPDRSAAPESVAFSARFAVALRELDLRLRREPGVADVTFSLVTPGDELRMALVAEGQEAAGQGTELVAAGSAGHRVRYNRVAANFFQAFDVPTIAGRDFSAEDLGTDRILVNRALAQSVFGTESPLGRRVRYVARRPEAYEDDDYAQRLDSLPPSVPLDQWFEIVGVVPDFPVNASDWARRVYHPVAVGDLYPVRINARVHSGDPTALVATVRQAAADVNRDLQVRDIATTEMLAKREQGMFRAMGITVGLVMLSVLLLSAAGIYALMSFAVARRRREIGIRAALGADPRRLLLSVFSRALAQLAAGALVGLLASVVIDQATPNKLLESQGVVLLPLMALMMIVVGTLSAIGPALEGLQIQPTEALRED